jgi:inosine/xanthosine triphosphatase
MLVVVGSQNPVKLKATLQAFQLYFETIDVEGVVVDSGVKPFPTSQEETLQGAINRVHASIKEVPQADFAVGIEAGIITIHKRHFVQAYTSILKDGQIGLGASAAFESPNQLLRQINPDSESSKSIIDAFLGKTNLLQQEGVIGILSQKRLTRTKILRDSIICALPPFLVPEYFGD